jgi:hypothetical protein
MTIGAAKYSRAGLSSASPDRSEPEADHACGSSRLLIGQ